jgi:hypothetical protein
MEVPMAPPRIRATEAAVRAAETTMSGHGIRATTRHLPVLALLLTIPAFFLAQPADARASDPLEPLVPLRTDAPPVIDGVLDDPVWGQAPSVTGFETWRPDFGVLMTDQTEVYYAYDEANLYFAFRVHDSDPGQIKTSVAARDRIRADDWVAINLDSFGDEQSLYAFYVNALGIQSDTRYAAGREDPGFDAVWFSAGVIDDQGYTVEVQIPLKSIRFPSSDPVEMGIIFERNIPRRSEMGTYPPLDPAKGGSFITEMHPIVFESVKHYTLFELLPGVTHSQTNELVEDDLVNVDKENDLSLTVKYGITSELILDGTINPDFSQIESDAGQIDINLRSPLFFPEKRPFFMEGLENFNFAGSTQFDPLRAVVHTRNIVEPILGGKITGKIGEKNTIAAIVARDEAPIGPTVGDHTDFGIFRYKRTLTGDSYIGGFFTDRERQDGYNRLAGIDGLFRLNESSTLGYHGFFSRTLWSEDVAEPHEPGDISHRDGHAVSVEYASTTREMTWEFLALDISKDFRTETGYVNRVGVSTFRAFAAPKFYPSESLIQRIEPEFVSEQTRDSFSGLWETYNRGSLPVSMPRSSSVSAGFNYSTEVYLGEKFDTSGLSLTGTSQVTRKLLIRLTAGHRRAIYYSEMPFQGRSQSLFGTLRYQATDKILGSLSYTYSNFTRESDGERIYDYAITRGRLTYQLNRYLFFRGIVEYNHFYDQVTTDFLASFTYIPGTVVHFGYGSLYERIAWHQGAYVPADRFQEASRGIFFKASYLWRK